MGKPLRLPITFGVDDKGCERLVQVSTVQVQIDISVFNEGMCQPVGQLFREGSVRLAGEHTVQVFSVEGVDIDRTSRKTGLVYDRQNDQRSRDDLRVEQRKAVGRRRTRPRERPL